MRNERLMPLRTHEPPKSSEVDEENRTGLLDELARQRRGGLSVARRVANEPNEIAGMAGPHLHAPGDVVVLQQVADRLVDVGDAGGVADLLEDVAVRLLVGVGDLDLVLDAAQEGLVD